MNIELVSKNRENTLLYELDEIEKQSKKGSKYFSKCIEYNKLDEYDTNCIPVAHFYDKEGKLQVVFSREPSHALGVGCTGAGKTTSLVIPKVNILSSLKTKPSFVIIDVKGELHDKLSGHLKSKGYDIKVIDLDEPEYSASWNPLTSIYDKYIAAHKIVEKVKTHKDSIEEYPQLQRMEFNEDVKEWYEFYEMAYSNVDVLNRAIRHKRERLIADVSEEIRDLSYMFIVTQSFSDPHWDDSARDLFAGVILAMLERSVLKEGKNLTRKQFNLKNIVNAILTSGDDALKDFINNSDNDGEAYRFASRIVNMEAEKTKSCYFGVLSTQLSAFKSYAIQKVTIDNSLDFSLIDEKPEALFIKMDDLKESNYKLAQLIILRLYQEIKNKAKKMPNRTLSKPVHFILDEFGNFPKFNGFSNMISVSRSYNIWYTIVIQSYSQLEKIYGKDVASLIIENSNMKLFFGTNDYETMKSFSESCGKKAKISERAYLTGTNSDLVNCDIELFPNVPISDLANIDASEAYIVCFRMPVLHTKMERYYLVKEFNTLPKVEYKQLDDISINSKEYSFNIVRDDYIKTSKVEYKDEYVPKKDPQELRHEKKMNNYIDKLLLETRPAQFSIYIAAKKMSNFFPEYMIEHMEELDLKKLYSQSARYQLSTYSCEEFYKKLNNEIIETYIDNYKISNKDEFLNSLIEENDEETLESAIASLKAESINDNFVDDADQLIKSIYYTFPKEMITNLIFLRDDFLVNIQGYIESYLNKKKKI